MFVELNRVSPRYNVKSKLRSSRSVRSHALGTVSLQPNCSTVCQELRPALGTRALITLRTALPGKQHYPQFETRSTCPFYLTWGLGNHRTLDKKTKIPHGCTCLHCFNKTNASAKKKVKCSPLESARDARCQQRLEPERKVHQRRLTTLWKPLPATRK